MVYCFVVVFELEILVIAITISSILPPRTSLLSLLSLPRVPMTDEVRIDQFTLSIQLLIQESRRITSLSAYASLNSFPELICSLLGPSKFALPQIPYNGCFSKDP
ncbi:unnamed protein product [Coffea canephora]|uniref:Uncharacterized protein n=1 Tax=Coffea canephora TaxID=49390 RepID=A0A068UAR0_COFCA|nr:unnamed protein product [Coffea canephora]